MLPAFGEFEVIGFEVCSYSDLKIGDTVIYWNEKMQLFVHHRIIAKQGVWFIVKGDNPETNPVPDPGFLTPDNFVARTHKLIK